MNLQLVYQYIFFFTKKTTTKRTKEPKQNENKVSNGESPTPARTSDVEGQRVTYCATTTSK